jgi:hypothetical protein
MGKSKLGLWGVVILTFIYLLVMNVFVEYVINREVDIILQAGGSVIALMYTVFMIRLVVNKVFNKLKKEEKND